MALLYGGYWDERDISIESAKQVAVALCRDELLVTPVRWDVGGWVRLRDLQPAEINTTPQRIDVLTQPGVVRAPFEVMAELRADGLGVVFLALHGGPGEDGTIQGFLEVCGVPYTGAGVHGSAIACNKQSFREAAMSLGIEVAHGTVIDRADWDEDPAEVLTELSVDVGFPAVVKPLLSGSSFGVQKVADASQLEDHLELLFDRDRWVLVEQFVNGREVTIPCLGHRVGQPPDVLPIVEIEPLTATGIFDVEAKYSPGRARETVPAQLDKELTEHLEAIAIAIHERLDLGAMSRTDVVLGAEGPVVLETNTIPGLTAASLMPLAAAAAGIDMTSLCRRIIDYALSAHLARGASAAPTAGHS